MVNSNYWINIRKNILMIKFYLFGTSNVLSRNQVSITNQLKMLEYSLNEQKQSTRRKLLNSRKNQNWDILYVLIRLLNIGMARKNIFLLPLINMVN